MPKYHMIYIEWHTFFDYVEEARILLLADVVHRPALQLAKVGIPPRSVVQNARESGVR